MKRKTMLLAVAALSALAFAVLPAAASALETGPAFETTPAVSLPEGKTFPAKFSGSSNETATLWNNGVSSAVCKAEGGVPARTVEGQLNNAHTGSAKFLFHNCKETTLNTKCTTPGLTPGTIETTTLPFHTVYLKPADPLKPHETPGVLFTPNGETTVEEKHWFAHYTCAGGLVKVTVGGTGVLGTVTAPGIGGTANSLTVNVSAPAGVQQHTETVEGKKFELAVTKNGGETSPAATNAGSATVNFAEGLEPTTTTETP